MTKTSNSKKPSTNKITPRVRSIVQQPQHMRYDLQFHRNTTSQSHNIPSPNSPISKRIIKLSMYLCTCAPSSSLPKISRDLHQQNGSRPPRDAMQCHYHPLIGQISTTLFASDKINSKEVGFRNRIGGLFKNEKDDIGELSEMNFESEIEFN